MEPVFSVRMMDAEISLTEHLKKGTVMIGSLGISMAALKAHGTKMQVTSRNIANINTEQFKKGRATLTQGSGGMVQARVDQIDTPGHTVLQVDGGSITEKELSNVDLTEEISNMIVTQNGYEANLKAIKTQDEMLGAAIDIVG